MRSSLLLALSSRAKPRVKPLPLATHTSDNSFLARSVSRIRSNHIKSSPGHWRGAVLYVAGSSPSSPRFSAAEQLALTQPRCSLCTRGCFCVEALIVRKCFLLFALSYSLFDFVLFLFLQRQVSLYSKNTKVLRTLFARPHTNKE